VAETYGNEGTGEAWERIYAAQPGSDGASGVSQPISGYLPNGLTAELTLAADGRTLYDVNTDGLGVTALRVAGSSVRRLPGADGVPYRAGGYGSTAMLLSGDQRFLYLTTASYRDNNVTRSGIRVFRLAS
jgi:hypothetical protein